MDLCNYPADLAFNGPDGAGEIPPRLPIATVAEDWAMYGANHGNSDEAERWLDEETEYHSGHVTIIDDEEFFNRYFGDTL